MKKLTIVFLLSGILTAGSFRAGENFEQESRTLENKIKKEENTETQDNSSESQFKEVEYQESVIPTMIKELEEGLSLFIKEHPEIVIDRLIWQINNLLSRNKDLANENINLIAAHKEQYLILTQSEEFSFQTMIMHLYKVHPTKTAILSGFFGVSLVTTIVCLVKKMFSRSKPVQKNNNKQKTQDVDYLLNY
jgi:hypothetical protein